MLAPEKSRQIGHRHLKVANSDTVQLPHLIATISSIDRSCLTAGDYLVFAGRSWKVTSVDDRAKIIRVISAPAGRIPRFEGGEGAPIHDRLIEEMKTVYEDPIVPGFLDSTAEETLAEAKAAFTEFQLATNTVVNFDGRLGLFLWRGSTVVTTLRLALRRYGIESSEFAVGLLVDGGRIDDLKDCLQRLAAGPSPDPIDLARDVATLAKEKYDAFLGADILRKAFAADAIAVAEIPAICQRLLTSDISGVLYSAGG